MSEDIILGYDVYSSALAEILSEPSLHTPITVGLYAKWGSGKSFLLLQLKNEMKSFAKLTKVENLKIDLLTIFIILMIILIVSSPFLFWNLIYGLCVFAAITLITMTIISRVNSFLR